MNGAPAALAAFPPAALEAGDCWNCGKSGHRLSKCKAKRDKKRIAVNRDAYRKLTGGKEPSDGRKRGGRKGRNNGRGKGKGKKWAPPGKGESDKKIIDGKPMRYNPQNKRWVPDEEATTAPGANLANNTNNNNKRNDDEPMEDAGLDEVMVAATGKIGEVLKGIRDTLKRS